MVNSIRNSEDKISIIIPTKTLTDDAIKCFRKCVMLDNNTEVFIVTDDDCPGLPAAKRNWAMKKATGKYLAFIDSDAYPTDDWLDNALNYLNGGVAAVCGPGILPPDSSLLERASDLILRCLPYSYRVVAKPAREVAEFPTFNLIVRRDIAPQFENYLTGEDSLFCRALPGIILYTPSVVVYHKRRPLFKAFLKQISTYAYRRGYLISLTITGLIATLACYTYNFFKGLLRRQI